MAIGVTLTEVPSCTTAVARERTTMAGLSEAVGRLLDPVWAFVRGSDLVTGHNVILYRGDVTSAEGALIEVGVQVDRSFTDAPEGITASELPAALVARAVHRGPYNRLGETHDAVVRWCSDEGHRRTGVCWEIYGDWTDDADALETEVLHELERRS